MLVQALQPADFVVEAINEDESSKKAAFLLLDQVHIHLRQSVIVQSCSMLRMHLEQASCHIDVLPLSADCEA